MEADRWKSHKLSGVHIGYLRDHARRLYQILLINLIRRDILWAGMTSSDYERIDLRPYISAMDAGLKDCPVPLKAPKSDEDWEHCSEIKQFATLLKLCDRIE